MKKKLYLFCVLVIMAICCSCGSTSSNKENDSEIENKPNEERMINDLVENNCNTISFTEWDKTITIPIVGTTLEKAKDDEESYIAYYILDLENNYYKAELKYSLVYSFYDVGGWMLDECKEESRVIESIAPDDGVLQEYIDYQNITRGWYEVSKLSLMDYEYVSHEPNYTWNCSYEKVSERKYANIYYEDNITCHFNQEKGWSFLNYNSTYLSDDWSKIIGKKFYTGVSNGEYFNVEIVDFNTYSGVVELKISGHTDRGWRMQAGDYYDEEDRKVYPYVDKTIYDIPETLFTENLNTTTNYEEYYYLKETTFVYSCPFKYELELIEGANPAVFTGSVDFDVDNGITYLGGFWERWTELEEVN